MALPPQQTLGALRDELAARLGFGAQIGNLGALNLILKSFLRDAQDFLWLHVDVPELRRDMLRRTNVGQMVYDYPPDCHPARILAISMQQGVSWRRLLEADTPLDEEVSTEAVPAGNAWQATFPNVRARRGTPSRFERRDQLWLHPVPEFSEVLRISYQAALEPFTQDKHRATLDSGLIFRLALADAKSHYKHPDAKKYEDRAGATLKKLRVSEHGERRYSLLRGDVTASPGRMNTEGDRYTRPVLRSEMES